MVFAIIIALLILESIVNCGHLCLFQDSQKHRHAAGWPKLLPHRSSHYDRQVQVSTLPASTPPLKDN